MQGIGVDFAFTQLLGSGQASQNKTYRKQHEEHARTTGNAHHLNAIDGKVVAEHAVAQAEEHHIGTYSPSFEQEKAVERKCFFVRNSLTHSYLNTRISPKTDSRHGKGEPEQDIEIVGVLIDNYAYRRCYGSSDIIAKPIETDAFGAPRRR